MSALLPIHTIDLFDEVGGHLVALLKTLSLEDWHRPTTSSAWQVKDVAAHLLDTNLRRLSLHRDGYASPHLRPDADGLLPFLTAQLGGEVAEVPWDTLGYGCKGTWNWRGE